MAQTRPTAAGGSGAIFFSPQSIYEASATKQCALGATLIVGNQKFRYAHAGGNLVKGRGITATGGYNHEETVTVAALAGASTLTVTNGTGATIALDEYAEGYLVVSSGTNLGQFYKIKGNTAAVNAATTVVTLYDPLLFGVSIAEDVTMVRDSYYAVQEAAQQLEQYLGTSLVDITAATAPYFWLLCEGPGPAIFEDAVGQAEGGRALGVANTAPYKLQAAVAGQQIVAHLISDNTLTIADELDIVWWDCA